MNYCEIEKKYIDMVIEKAFIVDSYETSNFINNKFMEEIEDGKFSLTCCGICLNLFLLIPLLCADWNIEDFLIIVLIANFPTILLYLNNLVEIRKLKNVLINKNDLLCYSSDDFLIKYRRSGSGSDSKLYVVFEFEDGFEFEIMWYEFRREINATKNYVEPKHKLEFGEYYKLEYVATPEYWREVLKSVNIYFYEKLLRKDQKACIITFDIEENIK